MEARTGRPPRFAVRPIAWRTPNSPTTGIGMALRPRSFRGARTKSVRFSRREPRSPNSSTCRNTITHSTCQAMTIPFSRGGSRAMGAFTMRLLNALAIVLVVGGVAIAQSPPLGVGRTPTPEEIRAWDISISPTGTELPPGHGSAKEGAQVYRTKGCAGCHGANLQGGRAPVLVKADRPAGTDPWALGRVLPWRAPYATIVWDYLNRGMPLNREGTLTADEVYALTAFLLFKNGVIGEDDVLDAQSLPKVKMPMRDAPAGLPEWKHGAPRLKGYPY